MRHGITGTALLCSLLLFGCSSEQQKSSLSGAPDNTPSTHVAALRSSFRGRLDAHESPGRYFLGAVGAERIERDGARFVPHVPPPKGLSNPVDMVLGAHANEPFSVTDRATQMSVHVTSLDATDAEGVVEESGYLVYPHGHKAGGDIVHRPSFGGTEDYVHFRSKPEDESLHYRIELHGVEGLRLVSETVELLDATGNPVLRMAPPRALDSNGVQIFPKVAVRDCAYDTDPRAPWGRAIVSPGSTSCRVDVSWSALGAEYPLLVDPGWQPTGILAHGRDDAVSALLTTTGNAIVFGGYDTFSVLNTTELFNASTHAWAATGPMMFTRYHFAGVTLKSGKVFATGGLQTGLQTNEVYDPSTGLWTPVAGARPLIGLQATLIPSTGKVVVTGGQSSPSANIYTTTTDNYIYDPTAGTFTAGKPIPAATYYHGASVLSNPSGFANKVLVAGGCTSTAQYDCTTTVLNTSIYDPVTDTWAAQAASTHAHVQAGVGVVASGGFDYVYHAMGDGGNFPVQFIDVFDTSSLTWKIAFPPPQGRERPAAAFAGGTDLLVIGGDDTMSGFGAGTYYNNVDLIGPVFGYRSYTALNVARTATTAARLADGSVLVIGGLVSSGINGAVTSECEITLRSAQGQACTTATDCTTGYCADTVCCTTPCASPLGCRAADTGLADGVCGTFKNGVTCTNPSDCMSGNCLEGVCCNTPCNSLCQSCLKAKSGVVDGTCANIPLGGDPDNECTAAGSGTCALTGACDGNGSCKNQVGTQCLPSSCVGASTAQPTSTCGGDGSCHAPGTVDCSPYICKTGACLSTCTGDTDCVSPTKCIGGTCGSGKGPGASCTTGSECNSNYCVDHVCCGSACAGPCVACTLALTGTADGTCASSKDQTDPHNDCASAGGVCGTNGLCNGHGACYGNASGGTSCGTPSCSGLSVVSPLCDGGGNCGSVTSPPCANGYACKAGLCLTSCGTDSDCASTDYCSGGNCVVKLDPGTSCSTATQCKAANCVEGVCCDAACTGSCNSCLGVNTQGAVNGHCDVIKDGTDPKNACTAASGNVCGADGQCGPSGQCRTSAPSGKTCGTGTVCVGSAAFTGQACDGNGACVNQPTQTACSGGYVCSGGTCLSTCGTNNDCISNYFCSGGACVPLLSPGATCSDKSQCNSGFCTEGVCCDSDCSGTCQGCLAGETISGVPGKCDSVKAGLDPRSQCAADSANKCGADGYCDGTGQCRAFANQGTICGGNTCVGPQTAQQQCDGSGTCSAVNPASCSTGYGCSNGTCLTSCATDTDCTSGYFCNNAVCSVKLTNGLACADTGQCSSGFCTDGVCCENSCTGPCVSCAGAKTVGGVDGKCDSVISGSDPRNQCAADSSNVCGADGSCDGKGACRSFAGSGAACGSTVCVGKASVTGQLCNGSGTCSTGQTQPCADGYTCQSGSCLQSCGGDTDCVSGYYCHAAKCTPQVIMGAACAADSQCATGHCADGYCCDSACTGGCQSCAGINTLGGVNGHCDSVTGGKDPHDSCTADSTNPCGSDGQCDGMGQCRTAGPKGTVCGSQQCDGDSTEGRQCDGFGVCKSVGQTSCDPFTCDAGGGECKTVCTTDKDCAVGAMCNKPTGLCTMGNSTCSDAFTVMAADGTKTSCSPYKCLNGACQQQCTSAGDCASGYDCTSSQCVAHGGTGGAAGAGGSATGGANSAGGAKGGSSTAGTGGTTTGTGGKASGGTTTGTGGSVSSAQGTGGASGSAAAPGPASTGTSGDSGGCEIATSNGEDRKPLLFVLAGLGVVLGARRRRRAA